MANNLGFIKRVIYNLKRRYGIRLTVLRRASATLNIETGVKTIVRDFYHINRGIVLPSRIHREFYYDLAFIAAAKNFSYGGHVDVTERRLILDARDCAFEPEVGHWITFDRVRYDVKEVSRFEEGAAYYVLVKQSIAAAPADAIDGRPEDSITLSDEATS